MFKRKPTSDFKIDTLIGAGTRIDGHLQFKGGLHLDGCINGNVTSADGDLGSLSVSEQGAIEGSVSVPNVILNGIVKGNIDALKRLELGEKARVLGNVRYSVIETAVGAQIHGKLIHEPDAAVPGESGSEAASGAVAEGAVGPPEEPRL